MPDAKPKCDDPNCTAPDGATCRCGHHFHRHAPSPMYERSGIGPHSGPCQIEGCKCSGAT